jgi:hypothetical protein
MITFDALRRDIFARSVSDFQRRIGPAENAAVIT